VKTNILVATFLVWTLLSPPVFRFTKTKEVIARTGSMLPTIPLNSTLIVDESFYASRDPKRFDIVMLRRASSNPGDQRPISMEVVSRVIGLPGEKISMRAGRIYINGKRVNERFSIKQCPKEVAETLSCGEMDALLIPAHEYFLLADNRPESEDSRVWSPRTIHKSEIIGKVIKIVRPENAVRRALGGHS
jgi:signal peptidase I